jgi:glucosamine-6-phosphate deaminase
MLQRALLDRVQPRRFEGPEPNVDDVDAECRRYHEAVVSTGLDLTILGLGRNGHLGLNEPGSSIDSVTRRVELTAETMDSARSYGADPPPTWGIALGMAEILASEELWLLVSGKPKASVLEQALRGPVSTDVPASFLQTHDNLTIFADHAAAVGL